jgi:KaiC/GvpD/RAD55 family RecA-like ATPase
MTDPNADLIAEFLAQLARLPKKPGPNDPAPAVLGQRIPTPWPSLDRVIQLRTGELVIVEGKTMSGRSLFGLNLAAHAAIVDDIGALMMSGENEQLIEWKRVFAAYASIDVDRIHRSKLSPEELAHMHRAAETLRQVPLRLWSPTRMSVETAAREAQSAPATESLSAGNARIFDESLIDQIIGELRRLIADLGLCVVVISQLPYSSWLTEGPSAIHAAADTVLRLERSESDEITVEVMKSRDSLPGRWATLTLDPQHARIADTAQS